MSELKPPLCPFCSGREYIIPAGEPGYGFVARCHDCGLELGPVFNTEDEAHAAWQSRALGPALDVVIAEVETLPAHDGLFETWRHNQNLSGQTAALYMLRALREQSANSEGDDDERL